MKSYLDEYKDLKEVILENPNLPIMFMVNHDYGNPDYHWSIAAAKAKVGIVFFSEEWNEEKIYLDEDDLYQDVEGWVCENHESWTELQKEEASNEKMKEFESKWENAILVRVEPY